MPHTGRLTPQLLFRNHQFLHLDVWWFELNLNAGRHGIVHYIQTERLRYERVIATNSAQYQPQNVGYHQTILCLFLLGGRSLRQSPKPLAGLREWKERKEKGEKGRGKEGDGDRPDINLQDSRSIMYYDYSPPAPAASWPWLILLTLRPSVLSPAGRRPSLNITDSATDRTTHVVVASPATPPSTQSDRGTINIRSLRHPLAAVKPTNQLLSIQSWFRIIML